MPKTKPKTAQEKITTLTKTQINLIELAQNSDISATAYMVNCQPMRKCIAENNEIASWGSERKTYFPLYVGQERVMVCVDQGSDLNLIQRSLFEKLFPLRLYEIKNKDFGVVKTFSNHPVKILGSFSCLVKPTKYGPPFITILTIIEDLKSGIPNFLFGNKGLQDGWATFAFTGCKDDPSPELIFKNPKEQQVKVAYEAPRHLYTVTGKYELGPHETKRVKFQLNAAAQVLRKDLILITPREFSNIHVLPSRSELHFREEGYIAYAAVTNLKGTHEKGRISATFEVLGSHLAVAINDGTKQQIYRLTKKYPIVQEILPTNPGYDNDLPVIQVNQVSVNSDSVEADEDHIHLENGKKLKKDEILSVNKETYTGTAEINASTLDTGLEVPTMIYKTAEEAMNLQNFEPHIRPFLKNIFLEKYPNTVALHSLDAGDVSKTLGYTSLRLIPGETLPRHKRIYHLSPQDTRYLEELLDHFIKFNYVMRAPAGSNQHLYGMSTYLVPRKKLTDMARLVIDFSPLTNVIQSPPAILPDVNASLQSLHNCALYSALDLKYAYLALRIDEESRPLTAFLTPIGKYYWLSLPTGAACSPAYFIDAIDRILHCEPEYDEKGNVIYESENKVKMTRDQLKFCLSYLDDIICSTKLFKTYEETLKFHFECLERIVKRLNFHNVKLSINKSEFAKNKILFLGWIVSHDFVIPDPRRMEKIRNAKFPSSKKETRAFIGLVNSIRRVIPFKVIEELQILTPLTSSSKNVHFLPNEKHVKAFERIKQMLLSEPLFCNLVDPAATKYIFVDASTSTGSLGAVLLQRKDGKKGEKILPNCLDLDDPTHRYIYDKELPYEPCQLYTSLPIKIPTPTVRRTLPPVVKAREKYLGYTRENIKDSLYWATASTLALYGGQVKENINEYREMVVQELKKGILGIRLKDQIFDNNHTEYRKFLEEYRRGLHFPDKDFIIIRALAQALHRCIILLSSLEEHREQPCIKISETYEKSKPPIVLGVYRVDGELVFLPLFHNKNLEFSIESIRGKVQIIAFLAKSCGDKFKDRPILDLEGFAILVALESFQKYVSGSKTILLTDSRVLYYLFHQKIGDSCVKIRRWVPNVVSSQYGRPQQETVDPQGSEARKILLIAQGRVYLAEGPRVPKS